MDGCHLQLFEKEHEEYLKDESRSVGYAQYISFPKNEDEIKLAIKKAEEMDIPLTVQGARTGISAGAVPEGGLVLNLSKMDQVTGMRFCPEEQAFFLTCQPGIVLSTLREKIQNKDFPTAGWTEESLAAYELFNDSQEWFFPPDPTETSATIGGMIACNASGARTFHYGPTRDYINALSLITADGSSLRLKRGENTAEGSRYTLTMENGKKRQGTFPGYSWPKIKNASGYYADKNMDLIDLFIGSEGTLGIVSEAELRLSPAPGEMWSMTAFFEDEESAVNFVIRLREERFPEAVVAAIEYFNVHALNLLREQRKTPAFESIPEISPEYHTAIYFELHGEDEEAVSEAMMQTCDILIEEGGDDEMTWIAVNEKEMEKLHFFRHATPEAVNLCIDERRKESPGLTKLGTDMAVPDCKLKEVIQLYSQSLKETDLEWVMFGHIGDNHIHVNILPNTMEEYEKGKAIYQNWAKEVIAMGGTVSAEHGIGKLKKSFLKDMYGEEGIEAMKAVKKEFDPQERLNKGCLFE